jgi:flagellar motility protein MotE (MotC chaperone)
MEDRDIRAVLSLMGDRQVAAILAALPAPRAATITKGATKASGADK